MATDPEKKQKTDLVKPVRLAVTIGALLIVLTHLLWPTLAIDTVTFGLLVLALLPWLAPIFKSLEFPGGWKVEFQDLRRAEARAEQAGLLAPQSLKAPSQFAFQRVAETDPNLALAGLRIEIEKRLITLAEKRGIEIRGRGIGQLLQLLTKQQALDTEARSVLADLTGLLNSAVHGASVDPRATEWAFDVGPRILKALDDLANEGP
jgi:hypothetical protein